MAYPTDADSIPNVPANTDLSGPPDHTTLHNQVSVAVEALETKVGIGASTPTTGQVLTGTSTGSVWAAPADVGQATFTASGIVKQTVYNVMDYGAVGDGVADDTTAIQSTINACVAAKQGIVFLPPGTFLISAALTISTSNMTFEGSGVASKLYVANAADITAAISITGTGTVEVKLRQFMIDGNSANQTSGHGIYISTPWSTTDTQHTLEDLYIYNCKNDGIHVPTSADTRVLLFNRVHVKTCGGSGFYFAYPSQTDGVFTDCIADTMGNNGFYVGGANNWFTNCKAFYCGSAGGNYHGFYIIGYNNYFEACQTQDNYQSGFYGDNSGDATYGSYGCTFVNCTADSNGQNGGTTYCKGFQLVGCQQWQITGGICMNRPYGSYWQNYGISFESAATNNSVTGVLFYGNNTGATINTGAYPNHKSFNNIVNNGNTIVWDPEHALNVRDFGAVGDGRRAQYVGITASSATVNCVQANFTQADVGKVVALYEDYPNQNSDTTGLSVITTIASVTDSSHAVLNATATYTLSGTSDTYMFIGTDDSAAIQAALTFAKLTIPVSLLTNPNESYGAGFVDVYIPGGPTTNQGIYIIGSQLTVPTGVRLDAPAMLVNTTQSNGTTPFIIFSPYSAAKKLLINNVYNSGIQAGTANGDLAQCRFDDVEIWHTGKASGQTAINLLGYDFFFNRVFIKNANTGFLHNTGSDFVCNHLFAIGCNNAVYMDSTQQAQYHGIFMDTCTGTSPYGGVCIDNQACNIYVRVHAFEAAGNNSNGTTPIISIGQVTASQINRDIIVDVQADNTGGDVVDIAYAEDTTIRFLGSNTATKSGNTNPIINGVSYGSGVDSSVAISGVLSTGITPYIGTLSGNYDYTQGGTRTFASPVSLPSYELNSTLSAGTASGITLSLTSAQTQSIGDVVQIGSSGQTNIANANAFSNASGLLIATASVIGSANNTYMSCGIIRMSSSPGWIPGNLVYLANNGTIGNTLTQTAPTGTNTITQVLGVALAVDTLFFNPSLVQVEHT